MLYVWIHGEIVCIHEMTLNLMWFYSSNTLCSKGPVSWNLDGLMEIGLSSNENTLESPKQQKQSGHYIHYGQKRFQKWEYLVFLLKWKINKKHKSLTSLFFRCSKYTPMWKFKSCHFLIHICPSCSVHYWNMGLLPE